MIIYIDMDDVLCDFMGEYHKAIEQTPEIRFPQSQFGFFERLPPITGTIKAVNELIDSERYEPYILTAPSTRSPFSYTEKRVWVPIRRKANYLFEQSLTKRRYTH